MSKFYAYLWLREDGTPYYAGKGKGKRAFVRRENHWPPANPDRIVLFVRKTEADAFATERELIRNWGRKDLGTGCLQNRTPGGDDPPRGCMKGRKFSAGHRQKLAAAKQGNRNAVGVRSEITRARMRKPRSHGWILTSETRQRQCAAARLREARKREQHG